MNSVSPSPAPPPRSEPETPPRAPASPADAVFNAYVSYLAGCFELASLTAGRRLTRAGVRAPLLNDA
jgi:hypothetical protein